MPDQEKPKSHSDILSICTAYEAGYGKGQVSSQDTNPYPTDSNEYEAWYIGYATAFELELERFGL